MTDIVVIRESDSVIITQEDDSITISAPGPQGATGPAGAGGSGSSYTHVQDTPLTQWNIPHMLGRNPQVTLIGTDGAKYLAQIIYPDLNNISIVHNQPVAGRAELS